MTHRKILLDRARKFARGQTQERRRVEDEAYRHRKTRNDVIIAAVDTIEFIEALAGSLDAGSSMLETITALIRASRERLQLAGVEIDGQTGEPFDKCRHHVTKQMTSDRIAENHVLTVINYGITCNGERIRPARVVVSMGETNDSENRN